MTDHSSFSMGVRFGRENSAGAGGYANRAAENMDISMNTAWDVKSYRGKGRRYIGSQVMGDEHSEGDVSAPLGFADMLVPLLGYVKNVAPVVGASSSQVWTIIPNPRGSDPIQTFVIETTDEQGLVLQHKYAYFTSFQIDQTRDTCDLTSGVYAQQTNVVPNYSGLAGPQAPKWTAATVYPLGAVVARATGVEVFQFRATAIAGTGTSGAVEPTWPTVLGNTVVDNPGANQITWTAIENISDMENVLIVPKDCDLFVSSVGMADLDVSPSQLLRAFAFNMTLDGGRNPFAPINSSLDSYAGTTEAELGTSTIAVDVGLDANVGKTDLAGPFDFAFARQNKRAWVRWQATGPLIGGSTYYLAQFDYCVQVGGNYDIKDVSSLFGAGIPLQIVNDPVVGYPWKCKIVNKTKSTLLTI